VPVVNAPGGVLDAGLLRGIVSVLVAVITVGPVGQIEV
jgi:hypothetical protein